MKVHDLPREFPFSFEEWSRLPFPPSIRDRLINPATLGPDRRIAVRPTLNGGGILLDGVRYPMLTIHEGHSAYGKVIGYAAWLSLRDVTFQVNETACSRIALGATHKHPMAAATGLYDPSEDLRLHVEVHFNPHEAGNFYRCDTREAIYSASRLTMIGTRCWIEAIPA